MAHITKQWSVDLKQVNFLLNEAQQILGKPKTMFEILKEQARPRPYIYLNYPNYHRANLPNGDFLIDIVIKNTEQDLLNMINDLQSYKSILESSPSVSKILIQQFQILDINIFIIYIKTDVLI